MAMRLTDTKKDLSGGGSSFFKLPEGQSTNVRFLYTTVDDIIAEGMVAHVIQPSESGQAYSTTVLCNKDSDDDPDEKCKWCASGNKQVGRYPLVLFNEDAQQVQYWLKSKQYVDGLLAQLSAIIPQGQPISGQIFQMIRTGKGTQTQYNIIPKGTNDGKIASQFGEIKAPEERNLIRPADYDFPVIANGGANFQHSGNYKQGNNFNGNFQSTRRTTDVF